MNLNRMYNEDVLKLGDNTLESLKIFVQSHLISQESRWMKRKAYTAWSAVQESLTMNLYDIVTELLRIQSRRDTLHQTGMLQAIADSIDDIIQTELYTQLGQVSTPLKPPYLFNSRLKYCKDILTKVLSSTPAAYQEKI